MVTQYPDSQLIANINLRKYILVIDHFIESKQLEDLAFFQFFNLINEDGLSNAEIIKNQLIHFFTLGYNLLPVAAAMVDSILGRKFK